MLMHKKLKSWQIFFLKKFWEMVLLKKLKCFRKKVGNFCFCVGREIGDDCQKVGINFFRAVAFIVCLFFEYPKPVYGISINP